MWTIACLALLLATPMVSFPAVKKQSFTTKKGLEVRLLADRTMEYVHAEILIFYKGKFENPAVPSLTLASMFYKGDGRGNSALISPLKKMGFDYETERTADYLVIRVNFLPDKLLTFIRFAKGIFAYRLFENVKNNPVAVFNERRQRAMRRQLQDSRKNYWRDFLRKENWKQEIAFQIAYDRLFAGHPLSRGMITAENLADATETAVRRFYQRVFRLPNGLLIMKGKLTPPLIKAYLRSEFDSFKKQEPEVPVNKKLVVDNQRKVIVFSRNTPEMPVLYWFDAMKPESAEARLSFMGVHHILFGFPYGRIHLAAHSKRLNKLEIQAQMLNHPEAAVICNIVRLRPRDIEPFIRLVDHEKKQLSIKKIDHREYLYTAAYFNGMVKVDTQHVESDINQEILSAYNSVRQEPKIEPVSGSSPFSKASLNRQVDGLKMYKDSKTGVIVIVGNYDMIRPYLKTLRHTVFKL